MESKRAKLEKKKKHQISDLPDHIIHHILSLLPSTKDAVQTGILSKRWEKQWTRVPVLIFDSTTFDMSSKKFLQFIDDTLNLHDCSKINKFHLKNIISHTKDPKFSSKVLFATTRAVEEIFLSSIQEYMLPEFLFKHASLVKLTTSNCSFMPNGKVNWECLTTLKMTSCRLADDQVMELILSSSPLLKTLLVRSCSGFKKLVIASKSLIYLYLDELCSIFYIEISCPKLKTLKFFSYLNVRTAKVILNLPPSLCATIDFNLRKNEYYNESCLSLIRDILEQLRHVKELTIERLFMENIMLAVEAGGQFSPVFNNIKFLFLKSHNISVIACLLRNSPVLEKLCIDVRFYDQDSHQDFGENYWSDATVFSGLLSHLKDIKIIGFPKRDEKLKVMLNFVQFILKNAIVLEKMAVYGRDDGTDFPLKVCQELLSLPRCSQYAIIKLECLK